MSKARDRADRKGSDPIYVGGTKLASATDGSDNLVLTDTAGAFKKIIASELEIGDSSNKVIIKKGSDNKVAFQTQASGQSAVVSNAGGGVTVYANQAALLAASGSAEGDLGFVTDSKKLMIRTTTGWYYVATVTNATPVITSAGSDNYVFLTDGTPIVIDVAATDAEGETLTYAYQVTAGSLGSTATVVQGSGANVNRFTITPSTDSNHAGSFSLKFSATDPNSNVALSSASVFTLAFAVSGSIYLDGSGDFITHAASTDFTMGTGDFTLEFWVDWADNNLSNNGYMISLGGNVLRVSNTSGVIKAFGSGSDKLEFTPTTAEKTGWHHIALVRNGNTNTVYYDGQSKVSATNATWNHTSNTMIIGQYDNGSTNGGYTWGPGYLSNIRIVKGTAVYTSNFTPSTAPLTAISGTVYLVASNIEPNTITNGSTLFTGSGVQITTPASSDFTLGTGDFTVEGWFNWANLPGSTKYIFDFGANGYVLQFQSNTQIGFWNGTDGYVQGSYTFVTNTWYHVAWTRVSGTGKCYVNGVEVASGTVSKNITTNTLTMNGYGGGSSYGQNHVKHSDFRVVKGKAVYTGNFSPPTGPLTKTGGTYPNNTNRSDPSASQTVLLTHQDTSGSTVPADNSDSNHTLTKAGAITKGVGYTQDTSDASNSAHDLSFYGDLGYSYATPFMNGPGGSAYFDGTTDYLTIPSSNLNPGTGDYTLECWIRIPTASSSQEGVVQIGQNPLSNLFGGIAIMHSINPGNKKRWAIYGKNATGETSGGGSTWIDPNRWYHVALIRDNGELTLYEDGAALNGLTDLTSTVDWTNFNQAVVGIHYNTSQGFHKGYISNLRFNHSAVYNASASSGASSATTSYGMLSTPASLPSWGTTWTLETWIYITNSATYNTFFNGFGGYIAWYSGQLSVYAMGGFSQDAGTFNRNQWHHIALVNNAGSFKAYIDGTESHSGTANTAIMSGGSGTLHMMAQGGNTWPTFGNMADTRLVIGTAVYSGNFTPPSGQLTITGGTYPSNTNVNTSINPAHTYLLTNQTSSGTTIADNSNQNYTMVTAGALTGSTDKPFVKRFTVPTTQLSAISGTKLLILNDSHVIDDASTHNHSITVNGHVYPNKFIPFS